MAKKIQINLSNKLYYTIILLGALIVMSWSVIAYSGNVGHTADQIDEVDPAFAASVVADGVQWGDIDVGTIPAGLDDGDDTGDEIPSGAVMYFNLASCPTDWSELVSAQGRYIVGLSNGGTLEGIVGTELSDNEDRAVGQHNHGASSGSAGNHGGHTFTTINRGLLYGTQYYVYFVESASSDSGTHSHSINTDGSVVGTNAPYIQLLVCQKD